MDSVEIYTLTHVCAGVGLAVACFIEDGRGTIYHAHVVGRALGETPQPPPGIALAVGLDSVGAIPLQDPTEGPSGEKRTSIYTDYEPLRESPGMPIAGAT